MDTHERTRTVIRSAPVPRASVRHESADSEGVGDHGERRIEAAVGDMQGGVGAMEEGMSGLYKNKEGEYDYERSGQNDKFPINSSADFGLDQVRDRIQDFQKKGLLPADFQNHITSAKHTPGELGSGGKPVTQNDLDVDNVENALALKAAYLKDNYNDIDSYAKQRGITLSPKARDFFALVDYNGGTGTGHQMLNDYYNNGHLEGDKFLQARPTTGKGLKADSYKQVYENVIRRTKMADALKNEGLFDN